MELSIQSLLGGGYKDVYNFRGRYTVIKGSRASKKSCDVALIKILDLTEYPLSNLLVVRKTYRSLHDSCFAQLKWAVNKLGLSHEWQFKENPMEAVNRRTNQHIYFRGLDDPLKITSITVDVGVLNFVWLEECYEVTSESDFDIIDESIRGQMPDGLWKNLTLTLNPWNERHWIKHRFFDEIVGFDSTDAPIYKERPSIEVSKGSYSSLSEDGQILAKTTNYLCNEWLDEADIRVFETMKINNPRRYNVAGLGGNIPIAEYKPI